MQILPYSVGIKLVRYDGPEQFPAPSQQTVPVRQDASGYQQTAELGRLADELSQIEQVRTDRVAAVAQQIQSGAYDTHDSMVRTVQAMFDSHCSLSA